ncbi:MAG: UbiA family prenyltransferase, partial [Bacteroidota bacterium]
MLVPTFKLYKIQPQLDTIQFIIFVIVTLLITACGYIINDLIDQKTDSINKPEKRIIGPHISVQVASWLYITLAIIGFFLALYLAFATDNLEWIFLYPLATIFLIIYSTHLKQRPLIGNLIVALLCSGVTGVVWIAEMESLATLGNKLPVLTNKLQTILIWYMVFAFLATLFREIIKDLQDVEGDQMAGCKTVPIVWGIQRAKFLALGIGGLLMVLIGLQFFAFNNVFQRSVLLYS